ncbi:SRPBCC domain-containing protein [Bacillus sp. IITD106]|nr:SRPBCC domain-containing protein [Bacillus sp. IITD106]
MEGDNQVKDIKQTVIIKAPIQNVWKTISISEGIAEWFMPNDFEPKVGYEFHLQSQYGPSPCKVLEIEEPYRLSFSWDTDGWFVTFTLKDLGEKTEFTVMHGGWKDADSLVPKAGEKASIIRDRMNQGWAGISEKLRKVVEG